MCANPVIQSECENLLWQIFRYRRTRKTTPLSEDFGGVCLKHRAFAYKPLVIAIWFFCQVRLCYSFWFYMQKTPSLLVWIKHLRESSALISSSYLKQSPASLSLLGHGERPHSPEHPRQCLLCSPPCPSAAGLASSTAALPRLCRGPTAGFPPDQF